MLAVQLGVGHSTVREAVRELAGQGVLEPRQGSGVFVTALDITEDWDVVLRRASIASVIEARIAVETEAGILAAQRRTPSNLRSIRRCLGVRASTLKPDPAPEASQAAHAAIVQAIADRDAGLAGQLTRAHLTAVKALLA